MQPKSKRSIDPDKIVTWVVYHKDFTASNFNRKASPEAKARAMADMTVLRSSLEDLINQQSQQGPAPKIQPMDSAVISLHPGQLELIANKHFADQVRALPLVAAIRPKTPQEFRSHEPY